MCCHERIKTTLLIHPLAFLFVFLFFFFFLYCAYRSTGGFDFYCIVSWSSFCSTTEFDFGSSANHPSRAHRDTYITRSVLCEQEYSVPNLRDFEYRGVSARVVFSYNVGFEKKTGCKEDDHPRGR